MRKRLRPLLAFVLVAGCATTPPGSGKANLDGLLSFTNPALCEPSPTFSAFLSAQVEGDANEGLRAGKVQVPPHYVPAIGRIRVRKEPHYWVVWVPVRGTWLGMPVLAVHQALPEGGDPGDFSIELSAPVSEAERRLKGAGFPARAGEQVTLGPPDGYAHVMTLVSAPGRPGRSMFGCGYE